VVAAALILVVRRRWPAGVLVASAALISTYLILGYVYGPIFFSFLLAVYTLARHLPPARSLPFAFAALAILLLHLLGDNKDSLPGAYGLIPASAWVVVPFAVGVAVRVSRESAARARAETIRRHVDDERLRVAQEVHDIVGHGLAAIKMQADIALHLLERKPGQARPALEAISRTSSSALDELRATLAAVRHEDGERSPALGLVKLEELAARMREAGLEVEVTTVGQPRELAAIVDLTGYRIVQESLTNVLRHSGSGVATVSLEYGPETLRVTVRNQVLTTTAGGQGGGLGIPGMRERVHALGGRFSAGPRDGGLFEVTAELPTGGHE
jgi:signal transduction histidine kinase